MGSSSEVSSLIPAPHCNWGLVQNLWDDGAIRTQSALNICSAAQLRRPVTDIRGLARDLKSGPSHSRCRSRSGANEALRSRPPVKIFSSVRDPGARKGDQDEKCREKPHPSKTSRHNLRKCRHFHGRRKERHSAGVTGGPGRFRTEQQNQLLVARCGQDWPIEPPAQFFAQPAPDQRALRPSVTLSCH
jgi:hypothetical protein